MKAPVPSETDEQVALIDWADLQAQAAPWWPNGARLVHIPNGSYRGRGRVGAIMGTKLRAMGLRAGFPDLGLFVPRQGYAALFIEMKKRVGGQVEDEQRAWHEQLRARGYRVEVCHGFEAARKVIIDYLGGAE